MALQVLFLGFFLFLLLSPGGQGDSQLQCPGDGESLQKRSGLGLEDPIRSLHWGAKVLQELPGSAGCAEACCALPRCNVAVQQESRCYLLDCIFQGKNVCSLLPRDGAVAYQKGEVAEQPTAEDFCLAPVVVGPCRAAFPRWYYDTKKKSCTEFSYGGCSGNLNNHITEEVCIKMCSDFKSGDKPNETVSASKRTAETGSVQEYCTLKPETGPCRAAFPRWYYDMEKKVCHKFTYGGCMGNKNNHDSETACMDKCATVVSEPEKMKSDKGVNFQEYCAAPSDTGPCRAAFPRWYYNISTHTCAKFIYGGCKGNRNNHQSEEVCKERCVAHPDAKEGYDPVHTTTHHSTTAVALAVLLAVMAAILLGAMVVVFVKVTRRNQESSLATIWSPIDDKECLMKNAYTL